MGRAWICRRDTTVTEQSFARWTTAEIIIPYPGISPPWKKRWRQPWDGYSRKEPGDTDAVRGLGGFAPGIPQTSTAGGK